VFGAQAVNLHGFPRATADLDLTIDLGDQPLSRFLSVLSRRGFDARLLPQPASCQSFTVIRDFRSIGPCMHSSASKRRAG